MKKISMLAVSVILILTIALTGCGKKDSNDTNTSDASKAGKLRRQQMMQQHRPRKM